MEILPNIVNVQEFSSKGGFVSVIEGCYDWTGLGPYEYFSIELTPGFYHAVKFWQDFVIRRLKFLESINQIKKLDGMFSKCPPLGALLVGHRSAFRKLDTVLLHMDKQLGERRKEFLEHQHGDDLSYELQVHKAACVLRATLEEGMSKAFTSPDRYRQESAFRTVDDLFPSLRPTKQSIELMNENVMYIRMWTRRITLENKEEQECFPNLDQNLELFQHQRSAWTFRRRWNTSLSPRFGPRKGYYDHNGVFVKKSSIKGSAKGFTNSLEENGLGNGCF